ncbi:energy transducer TonB [Pleurocapsales cyanobacterium LEGE 10410]|nr:energy transducer TonB [Pleurocapsales cyanobacterium LEGE 10410]
MSYESKLNNQSGRLINPTQLCLLLSVGFHLLVLKFGLPTIRLNQDSGEREVSIIELNPEQQARLPNLYPQLDTSDIPNVPDFNNFPTADNSEPAAPFAIPPDLIPGIGDNSNLTPLVIPPPPQFNLPPLPPQTDIRLPPVGDLSDLPLPPEIDPSDFEVEPIKLPPNMAKPPEKPSDLTTPNQPSQPAQPPSTATKPEQKPDSQPTSPTPEQPEAKPEPTPEQIAARRFADSQQRIRNLAQSLTKTEAGTTNEEARKNYVAWLAKVQDIEPENIEIKGTYPRDACIRRLEGSSVFGVVANAEGEVVALDLIKGAEYPLFNQQASNELGDRTLDNETEQPKPYQVTVNYEYDPEICPSLTLPSLRTQEKPQPKPEQPKPAPVPQSEETPEPTAQPEAEPKPLPSLRDRLRNVPLFDRKPSELKDLPLPDKPNVK